MSVHCQYNVLMQKAFTNGNSITVTIPKIHADAMNIKSGTPLSWEKTDRGLLLYKTQETSKSPTEVDPEVVKLIKKISKKYSSVWQELAKL